MKLGESGLKYLYESYRRGTMRAASEHFNMAPSSISRQINRLEAEMGLPLIERGRHTVKLTPAGQMLIDYYRDQLGHHEALMSAMDDLRGLRRGNVTVAIGQGLLGDAIVLAIRRFLKQYPGLRINLKDAATAEALNMVREDEAHFGILLEPNPEPSLQTRRTITQPVRAIVPGNHPLARHAKVSVADLLQTDLILPTHTFRTRQIFEKIAREQNFELDPIVTSSSIQLVRSLVLAGAGVAVLPETVVKSELQSGLLTALPITEKAFNESEIHLVYRRGRKLPKIATVLMQLIEQEIQNCAA
ncbi:LysR family transcriptional regulator [Pusillimonas sp. NJUB218]|uniref:LysR family transcriptional regulator n=1 Tax=Pusillimonas sp. NJUB218 TaxID=2023230 RepID=UPI000F4C7A3B|nr:LysR family transcriptional regulator [Pusillimonas sp. NJUB218]ROT45622.1 hypothetical protein CHR62_05005 [Pusillimonas sp. NJUB218]